MRRAGRNPRKRLIVVSAHSAPAHIPVLQLLQRTLWPLPGHILAIVAIHARKQLPVICEAQLGGGISRLEKREVNVATQIIQRDGKGFGEVVCVGKLHGQVPDEGAEVGGCAAFAGCGVEIEGVGDGWGGGVGTQAETFDSGAGVAGVQVAVGYVGGRVGGHDAQGKGGGLVGILGDRRAGQSGAEEGGCCAELHVGEFVRRVVVGFMLRCYLQGKYR